jgi:hypothetical protein
LEAGVVVVGGEWIQDMVPNQDAVDGNYRQPLRSEEKSSSGTLQTRSICNSINGTQDRKDDVESVDRQRRTRTATTNRAHRSK